MSGTETNERFARWQARSIEQLSYAINLVLGLSVAALGFEVSVLLNDNFHPGSRWQRFVFLGSLILLCVSIGLGVSAIVTRLMDFRLTAKLARHDASGDVARTAVRRLGTLTWGLFWFQFAGFCGGMVFAAFRICALAIDKLG